MSIITSINVQTKNKKRCNLFIDGEFYSGISVETVLKYRIKVGQEIDKSDLDELIRESDKIEALTKGTDYISSRLKTKKQVKDYLIRKGYSEDISWYVVDKLKEYGYINDKEYSERYIECQSKTEGRRLAEYKLMAKGVRKEDINFAFDNVEINAKENAKILAEKRLKNIEKSKENLAKTYRYLISRGFNHDEAGYAISFFKDEN